MRYVVMAMIVGLTSLDLSEAQAIGAYGRESLRGLPGVEVLIEELESDVQADGLSTDEIRTTVERIIWSSRIQILTHSERIKAPSAPYLYVRVGTFKRKLNYSLCVYVSLKQRVSLFHRPQRELVAATWESSMVGTGGASTIGNIISVLVEPQVKEFAKDFLTVNPP